MNQCSYLPSLTHFSIHHDIKIYNEDVPRFFTQISKLPKLIYCYLDIYFEIYERTLFPNESNIFPSLRHLTINFIVCSAYDITRLNHGAPHLQTLSINFEDSFEGYTSLIPNFSITRLEIIVENASWGIKNILKSMPNLHHLTCELCDNYINGNKWEAIINDYLPKLKNIHLRMKFKPPNNEDKEKQLNEIVDSFRTDFWINKYKRFVRCYWHIDDENKKESNSIHLFTLPYIFSYFDGSTKYILTRSTCSSDNDYLKCNKVNSLEYYPSYFADSVISLIRFNNIQSLTLKFPLNEQFFSIVSNFNRLTSLFVHVDEKKRLDNIQSELQLILDRPSSLYSLSFGSWSPSNSHLPLKEFICASVRQLYLREEHIYYSSNVRPSFDEEQCIELSRSLLGIQCETLSIKVKKPSNILDLVNNMPNLRALNVICEGDDWREQKVGLDQRKMMNLLIGYMNNYHQHVR